MQTRTEPLTGSALRTLTAISIVWDVVLAVVLGPLIDRVDSPYYVLLLVPILLAWFRRSALETLLVVIAASVSQFYVVWRFFQFHPPAVDEYFEAGTTSLIFLLTGVLVWFLVNNLRRKEIGLAENLLELTRTRERLLQEEKLAAVGRLSAAIADEIRNSVAMISSSLGLALAHKIVRGHSGVLLLTLNTPETVRFTLTLPCKATSQ